jgi:hypothetical protein
LWGSLRTILEEQFLLSRKCSMSPTESNLLPDFEREVYISLLIKEIEEEKKSMDKK